MGLSVPVLSACGDDGDSGDGGSNEGGGAAETSSPADSPTSTTPSSSSKPPAETPTSDAPSKPPVDGIAATGEVPVGGGVVVADAEVVITQPARGEFKVFTAICTHKQCLVSDVDVTINCTCHKSKYDIATGEPTSGPAPSALDPVDFRISADQVVLS